MKPSFTLRETSRELEQGVLTAVQKTWTNYIVRREQLLEKPGRGHVHHLRTAIRRLEALLDLLQSLVPVGAENRLRRRIDRELKSLGDLRDLHVQQKRLREDKPKWVRRRRFVRYLKDASEREKRRALDVIGGTLTSRLGHDFATLEKRIALAFADDERQAELGPRLCRHFERQRLKLQADALALDERHSKSFHHLRVDVKSSLYQLEMFSPFLEVPEGYARRLARLKDRLGRLQDEVAIVENARGFYRKTSAHPHPKRELRRGIRQRQRELIPAATASV